MRFSFSIVMFQNFPFFTFTCDDCRFYGGQFIEIALCPLFFITFVRFKIKNFYPQGVQYP